MVKSLQPEKASRLFLRITNKFYLTAQVAQMVKNPTCQCRRDRLNMWVGRFPGEGNVYPL